MLEHAGYSQAPSPGTSFSGVTPNGAPNAHYYLNSGKAASQQQNATPNNHHPRPNGTGTHSNGIGGVNNGVNASFNPGASTTTTTTNSNSTTSHANGTSNKGSPGPGAGGGSITVTVTATTTTTTTATATATTNANSNSHTHPHAYAAMTPNSAHHHQHTPNSSAKKVKTKRTKRAFAPHSISASRPGSEKTPSAGSSPVTCRHEVNSPKSASHQENPPAKSQPNSAGWNSVKRSVSCASPSVANAGRSPNPGLKEQQRSSSITIDTGNSNGNPVNGSLPAGVSESSEPATASGDYGQRPPTDVVPVATAYGVLYKDLVRVTAPRPQNGQANSGPVMNGFHNEFSASPSPSLLRSDSEEAKSKTSKNGTTPTPAASKQQAIKPSSLRKDNRALKSTPTSVQAIEMRSFSSTPKSQSSARPTTYQESTPGSGYTSATNLDSENGVSNGTLGKRKQADPIGSGKDAVTTLKSLGTLKNPTTIKKFTINGRSHTAVLVTSRHPVMLPNGYTLNPQSPVVIVDDNDGTSSASPVLTLNKDDQANSASPVNLYEDGNSGSASPVVMMDLDESVGSAGSVIMVDGDTDTPRPVVMTNGNNEPGPVTQALLVNGDGAGPANQNVTVHGVDEARPITPVPVLTNGFAHLAASRPRLRVNREKKAFDSDAFDALIYAQPGASSPPKGVSAFGHGNKGSNRSQFDDRLYLRRDPAIQGMHERSEEWYRKKLALRPPGARKKWFGRVRERQRWLKSQQDKLSPPSDNGLRERGPKRKDPEPWTHQRSLDFGDVPEDDLPSYVKENPAWLKFCGRLRDARTRKDVVDSTVQHRERVKQQVEVEKRPPLTRKEIAQRQLASKFMRQTEEFYNSMKQA